MSTDHVVAGRYRLTERLGGGGMGVVWKADDERLRRTVAVKEVILPPGLDDSRLEEIRRRTMREGRIAAKLHHPQLTTVYDVIEDDGRPYLIIEYLPSTNLSSMLAERGTLPPVEVARIGAQVAAALAAAHAAGVVHRDVKPSNILVGDNGTVKLTDFGVSRVVEDVTGTSTGTFVGTPAYLSPEVAQGRPASFESDVYSLGAALYQAVEGSPPVGSSDNPMFLLHRIASGVVVPPTSAGPLTDLLLRLLAAEPEQRPTMAEARAALTAIADGQEPPAPTEAATAPAVPVPTAAATPATPPAGSAPAPSAAVPTAAAPANRPTRRRRPAILLALVCVLVATTTALVLVNLQDDTPATNADPGSSSTRVPTLPSDEPTEEPADGDSAEPAPPATASSSPPPSPSNTAPAVPPPANQPAADPGQAVADYYALVPGNLDEGFTRLSPRFQRSPAGGMSGYQAFWNQMSAVAASGISATGDTVEVTIDYTYKDGRKVRERHRYGLVSRNGQWLIDSVAVLSTATIA